MDKDFKLKTGDKIVWVDRVQNKKHTCIVKTSDHNIEQFESYCVCGEVVKVLRPTGYKTVYEVKKEVLDEEEKEYLRAVIKPFRNRINYIRKKRAIYNGTRFIEIKLIDGMVDDVVYLPYFQKDTMYKGMETNKAYTLKELGLE